MKNVNMNAAVDMIRENAKNVGIREATTQYLAQIAENLPDGKLPNGYTAEQAADEILSTCVTYTDARDAKITKDDLHEMIAKHCRDMTSEQAAEYLAGIHFFYNNLGKPPLDSSEQIASEIRRMARTGYDGSLEEHIDHLLDSLDPLTMPSVFGFVHQLDENKAEVADGTFVSVRLMLHLDAQENALYATAYYGEVVQGNVEDMPPETNPGVVAAGTCAAADAAKVSQDALSGVITAEEAEEQLNLIERAFMAALAGLWGAAYMALGLIGAATIFEALLSVGVPYTVAWLVGFFIVALFGDDLVDQVKLAHRNVTAGYLWLKKHTRPFRTKVGSYISNAVQAGRNYFNNPARA